VPYLRFKGYLLGPTIENILYFEYLEIFIAIMICEKYRTVIHRGRKNTPHRIVDKIG
jgi:hypothetical protein